MTEFPVKCPHILSVREHPKVGLIALCGLHAGATGVKSGSTIRNCQSCPQADDGKSCPVSRKIVSTLIRRVAVDWREATATEGAKTCKGYKVSVTEAVSALKEREVDVAPVLAKAVVNGLSQDVADDLAADEVTDIKEEKDHGAAR